MNQPKVPRLALPRLPIVRVDQIEVEEGVVVSRIIIFRPCGELLVSGHEWGGDVVGEEVSLGVDV